jgi:hypothetical protein
MLGSLSCVALSPMTEMILYLNSVLTRDIGKEKL